MSGPTIWSVHDSDNYECGGIHSLHWSEHGAIKEAHRLVKLEDIICKAETGQPLTLTGPREWKWKHRTIKVEMPEVCP